VSEIWGDVIGYEGLYQASDQGRVKRLVGYRCRVERLLKPCLTTYGYLKVNLCRDGKRTNKLVHHLVLEAHVGEAPEGCQANHKNGVKADNRVENLEWVTSAENTRHAIDVLGKTNQGKANGNAELTDAKVIEIREFYATGDYSQAELGMMFNVEQNTISQIVNHGRWKHVGGPAAQKGYRNRGETNGRARATSESVIEIRELHATGKFTQAELAERFGVARNTIGDIVNRRTWKSGG